MNDVLEKLQAIRAKYLAALERVQGDIVILQEEAKAFATKVANLEDVIKEVREADGDSTPLLPGVGNGKYANSKLTDAIADVIKIWGSPPGLLVPEIIAKLESDGFKSK